MKRMLITAILLLSSFLVNSQCVYVLCLKDAVGYGWNGAAVAVFINGSLVGTYGPTFTQTDGLGPICFPIYTKNGDVIDIIFSTSGEYPDECSFELIDPSNSTVGAGNASTDIENYIALCPCGPTSVSSDPIAVINCDGSAEIINFSAAGSCIGNFEFQVLNGNSVVQAWSNSDSYISTTTNSASYTVKARCSTCSGTEVADTFHIEIIPPPIIAGNLSLCAGDATRLKIDNSGDYEWWSDEIGGTLLEPSNTFNTPALTNTSTYWVQSEGLSMALGKIFITECGIEGFMGAGTADYLEVSNLFSTPVNTTGWVAAVSGNYNNINSVNPIIWNMPSSFSPCSVVSKNDICGDPNYWGNNIMWNPLSRSWAIIIDDLGNVIDFVAWGWTAADIAGFNTTINGFNITLGSEWSGHGYDARCGIPNGLPFSIQRVGNRDRNTRADFICHASTVNVLNPDLSCGWLPTTCRYPVTVIVNPTPTVTAPVNVTYCVGDNVPSAVLTGSPIGTTYSWVNDNPSIGLAARGTGNIPAFLTSNSSSAAIRATISVTPTLYDCIGPSANYTITVNPIPQITVPVNAAYCVGEGVPLGILTGAPLGASYYWANTNPDIGLTARGTGYVPTFTTENNSSSPILATISVSSDSNYCPVTYNITVNPTPRVAPRYNKAYCVGDEVPIDILNGTPVGAKYSWTNTNTAIGLTLNGTGNIPTFTATNTTADPISGNISVIPFLNGCIGIPGDYTITINPIPSVWVPDAFTPNRDGLNDIFYAVGENVEKYSLKIFNRWGKLLFESNNIGNGWDGTYQGQLLPFGAYVYLIDYSYSVKNNILSKRITGSVMLLK